MITHFNIMVLTLMTDSDKSELDHVAGKLGSVTLILLCRSFLAQSNFVFHFLKRDGFLSYFM